MQEPVNEEAFRAQLKRISHFFDRLVDMVPAKHYVDDGREGVGSLKYLKKSAKLEAKHQRKEAGKKRKRENLDPDKQQSTLEVQVRPNYPSKCQYEYHQSPAQSWNPVCETVFLKLNLS